MKEDKVDNYDDILKDVNIKLQNIEVKDGDTLILQYHEYGFESNEPHNVVVVEISSKTLSDEQKYTVTLKCENEDVKKIFTIQKQPLLFNLLYYLAMDNDSISKGSLLNKEHKEAFVLFCKKYLQLYKNINIGEKTTNLINNILSRKLYNSTEKQFADASKQLILDNLKLLIKHVSSVNINKNLQQEQKENCFINCCNSCYNNMSDCCNGDGIFFDKGQSWLTSRKVNNNLDFVNHLNDNPSVSSD